MNTHKNIPFIYGLIAIIELGLNFFKWGLILIFSIGLYLYLSDYSQFKNEFYPKLEKGTLKIRSFDGSRRSVVNSAHGYIVEIGDTTQDLSIAISQHDLLTNQYFDESFKNKVLNDTLNVWYSPDLKYVIGRFSDNKNDVKESVFHQLIEQLKLGFGMLMTIIVIHFIFKKLRIGLQNTFNITPEEHSYYIKNRNKK